jgi:hypothetical protein
MDGGGDVGFNMSWICVDGISQDALHEALDLVPTGETAGRHDLGTSGVPWAGVTFKSGWCAVFAKYALVMDVTVGTKPPRLARLPATSRIITCVVLEHAMISYASLWQGGRCAWQIRHDCDQGTTHLDAAGDLPPEFAGLRDAMMARQRAEDDRRGPGRLGVDYVFDVPLDTAAVITGYRHTRAMENELFLTPWALAPTAGNVPTKLSQPPTWWQTAGSIRYE